MRTGLALFTVLAIALPAQEVPRAVGRPAPEWSAVRTDGRGRIGPRDLCGDVVLVAQCRSGAADFATDVRALSALGASGAELVLVTADGALPGASAAIGTLRPVAVLGAAAATGYRAGDVPWVAVHDRRGLVRHVGPLDDRDAIQRAVAAAARERRPNPLVGRPLVPPPPEPAADAPAGLDLPDAGELYLLRWWTVSCPFCRASLPDLEDLAERHPGLVLVPVFHRKGPTEPTDAELRAYLDGLGVGTRTLRDPDWVTLRPLMRRAGLDRATSVSFLVDRQGVVRWVHPGPRLHRDPTGEYEDAARDLAELETLVARWLDPDREKGVERRDRDR